MFNGFVLIHLTVYVKSNLKVKISDFFFYTHIDNTVVDHGQRLSGMD